MAKTVAELQEEAKRKMQEKKNENQNELNETAQLKEQVTRLEAQTIALQEQLSKNSRNEEEMRLAQEAEALKKQEEALMQETNIQKILDEALKTENAHQMNQDEESPLSQKELASVIAEAVGRSVEASTKLTEVSMDKKLAESNAQIVGLQKVMVDLLGSMSVEKARGKHEDFDKYSDGAREVLRTHPSLSPEEAYLLHKAKEASKVPDEKVQSEKPNEPPAWTPDRPFSTERRERESFDDGASHGNKRRNFRQQLSAAIDEHLSRR
jgi:CRISPR/Cas system CSM-associated protein Csm2 small subunit